MPTTANTFPTTASSVDRSGATAWTSPTSIGTDNAADATCASGATGSDYLVGNTFGFSIPSTATIVGVLVRVEASEHSTGTEALLAQLQDESAALFGSARSCNEGNISGTGKAIYTYGSASDLWEATLTPAIVNDADFGVRLWFVSTHDIRIDFVTIAITYSELATGTMAPSLPLPTMSATGTVSHVGTMAPSLLLPTMSASGSAGAGGALVTGTIAANLLLPTSTATGSRVETGTIATSVPLPTMAATGSRVETGTMTPSLLLPTSSMSGIVNTTVTGTAAPILPLLTASMSGTVGEVGGGGGGSRIGLGYTIGR